ncbi:hypothetical protein U8607_23930 [Methylobacterium durans]|uniref:hypothetical protein n=1 Tax=Methylobacterium durans TaxID=2202825 RepID=UPI002AFEA1ED|nr:hypothetical protein [Methylobacterium durans]MEA1835140.1 hypothetical protein [Methylobacterium durans]
MGGSSADIEALLVNVNDPDDPTPQQLPAIFRDIVGRLNALGLPYAVLGHIALARHEQARCVSDIEIVAALGADGPERAAALARETRERYALYMDQHTRSHAITLSLRPCSSPTETQLLAEADTCTWFGIEARLASAEHLLWHWCCSDALAHRADAAVLIRAAPVDLQRVLRLLRGAEDAEESAQMRLRLAIGEAALTSEFSFSRYMEERRARLKPDRVPVRRLRVSADPDGAGE